MPNYYGTCGRLMEFVGALGMPTIEQVLLG
jgi:hypothetical protein